MGVCMSYQDSTSPFSNKTNFTSTTSCCSCFSCCFPWSLRSVPSYDYDEMDDDLEFETLLAAQNSLPTRYSTSPTRQTRLSNTNYTHVNTSNRNNQKTVLWDRIAGLFSGKRRKSNIDSPVVGYVRGYQAIATSDPSGDTKLLFGHELDVPVLTEEEVQRITKAQ